MRRLSEIINKTDERYEELLQWLDEFYWTRVRIGVLLGIVLGIELSDLYNTLFR